MPLLLLARSLPFSKDESTQWIVLAAGMLATMYVVMRSRSRNKRVDPLARQSAGGMSLSQQRQVERDIGNLMVEMLETARQMTAQLDTRAARLEVLSAQADDRLAALKATGGPAPTAAPATVSSPAARPTHESEPAEAAAAIGAGADAAPTAIKSPPDHAPEPAETPPDPRHAEIYALADRGHSPREIARSLDRPNGEVELILALRAGT